MGSCMEFSGVLTAFLSRMIKNQVQNSIVKALEMGNDIWIKVLRACKVCLKP